MKIPSGEGTAFSVCPHRIDFWPHSGQRVLRPHAFRRAFAAGLTSSTLSECSRPLGALHTHPDYRAGHAETLCSDPIPELPHTPRILVAPRALEIFPQRPFDQLELCPPSASRYLRRKVRGRTVN